MQISLLPKLTDDQRQQTREWVTETLASEQLAAGYFPLDSKIVIYIDGRMRVLRRGEQWQDDGSTSIYVGYTSVRPSRGALQPIERLAVVGAVISLAELWDDFHETYIAKAASLLISAYEGIMSGLIQTEAAISGLAFNAERAIVAGKVGDTYHLADGTEVEIDDTWTVVPDRPGVRAATAV